MKGGIKVLFSWHLRAAVFIGCLVLSGRGGVFGIDIVIIPITYSEKSGNNYAVKSYGRDISEDIGRRLNIYHTVQVDREHIYDRQAGVTGADARRAAEYYNTNDILYGVMRGDGQLISMELKIYNRRQERHELFFAGDTLDCYERLIEEISGHILEWYRTDRDKVDALRFEVGALKKDLEETRSAVMEIGKAKKEKPLLAGPAKEVSLKLPIRAGYWSYLQGDWTEMVQGMVEWNLGLDFYPQMQFPAIAGMRNELSAALFTGHRFGMAAGFDSAEVHHIIINPAAIYHLNVYSGNWLSGGAGIFFEYGIWHIERLSYNESIDSRQALTGSSILFDYSYRFNKYITLDFGVNLYLYFAGNSSPVIRSYLGTAITLFGGDYEK
ncbi:MAG: hypothetical protein LBU18_00960 [Treponema sp.]|nr:hypothetical protein [Treponema sp.]